MFYSEKLFSKHYPRYAVPLFRIFLANIDAIHLSEVVSSLNQCNPNYFIYVGTVFVNQIAGSKLKYRLILRSYKLNLNSASSAN